MLNKSQMAGGNTASQSDEPPAWIILHLIMGIARIEMLSEPRLEPLKAAWE
jgi:hypothetical protein